MLLRPAAPALRKSCRHPLYLRYGADLPSSLTYGTPDTPEASNLGTPVSDLGTVFALPLQRSFHCLLESGEPTQWLAILVSDEFSSLRHSLILEQLNRAITLLAVSGRIYAGCALRHGNAKALEC